MKTVYQDEKNVVLYENSVEIKPCINRESKSDELTIYLYICQDINMRFLVFVTPPSIYHITYGNHNLATKTYEVLKSVIKKDEKNVFLICFPYCTCRFIPNLYVSPIGVVQRKSKCRVVFGF